MPWLKREQQTQVMQSTKNRKARLVYQKTSGECGLACLSMIFGAYGGRKAFEDARRKKSPKTKSSSLKDLAIIARQHDFEARAFHTNIGGIHELTLPCILHLKANHYIVLDSFKGGTYRCLDPEAGVRQLSEERLAELWSGYALQLVPAESFRSESASAEQDSPFRVFAKEALANTARVENYRRKFGNLLAITILVEALTLAAPLYSQKAIDLIGQPDLFRVLTIASLLFILLAFFQYATALLNARISSGVALDVSEAWFDGFSKHVFFLRPGYFRQRKLGDVFAAFSSVDQAQRTLTSLTIPAGIDVFFIIGCLVIIFQYEWTLAAFAVFTSSALLVTAFIASRKAQPSVRSALEYGSERDSSLIESIQNYRAVFSYNSNEARRTLWANFLKQQLLCVRAVTEITSNGIAFSGLVRAIDRVIALGFGASLVSAGDISIGALVAVIGYRELALGRVSVLATRVLAILQIEAQIGRISVVLSEPIASASSSSRSKEDIAPIAESIVLRMRDVTFAYSIDEKPVIRNLSLDVRQGEFLVLEGESGSGKSTILALMAGWMDLDSGSIEYLGRKVSESSPLLISDGVATLFSADKLLAGTIIDNITFFAESVDKELLIECSRMADLDAVIASAPKGLNTVLSAGGPELSMGQAQRVLLARALYSKPSLLLLDEISSHLDSVTEAKILENLKAHPSAKVVATHSATALALADRSISVHIEKN